MNFTACSGVTEEPQPQSVAQMLVTMRERIEGEEIHTLLNATEFEKLDRNLKRFLAKHFYDIEIALTQWNGWVKWRHDAKVDSISELEIENERKEGILTWRGKNKDGMLCCVITGRLLHPTLRRGTPLSFRKHMVKVVDEGLRQADELEQQQVCVVYDRRGLEWKHIDPNLYMFCKREFEMMRDFYGDRVGAIYILHTNLFFWALYYIFLIPLSLFWTNMQKLIILEKVEDLLEFFDEDQVLLTSPDVNCDTLYAAQTEEDEHQQQLVLERKQHATEHTFPTSGPELQQSIEMSTIVSSQPTLQEHDESKL